MALLIGGFYDGSTTLRSPVPGKSPPTEHLLSLLRDLTSVEELELFVSLFRDACLPRLPTACNTYTSQLHQPW